MVKIENLVAAIVPDIYCDPSVRSEVKKIAKKDGYLAAAEKVKLVEDDTLFSVENAKLNPLKAAGIKAPSQVHKLVYDSASDSLEPIYFWILDFMNGPFRNVEKLTDNFVSSVGSSFFSELGGKATRMQEEASKMMGNVNVVLKSILNIIYDLKEFQLRLKHYEDYNKSSGAQKEAALLSLKQIWLDNVDIKRGNTSIKGMAQQFDYVTIIDAFMAASSLDSVKKLDLNERVQRILLQRYADFEKWLSESEKELRKRYEIERKYLQSQVNSVKLYARWIKPYLEASRKLEQRMRPTAALVSTFNTLLLELSLLGSTSYDPKDDVQSGDLPEMFKTITNKEYLSIVYVDFKFRGIPQRAGQGYTFGGRTEIVFRSFALTKKELKILKDEFEKSDFDDSLQLIEGATTDSLAQIKGDIEEFLGEKKSEEKKKDESNDDSNPFKALFSFFFDDKKPDKKDEEIGADNSYEKVLRSQAIIDARDKCTLVFETYKKAHQMPAF